MRDGPVRCAVKLVALARFRFDLGVTRAIRRLRGKPDYVLGGSCEGCGGCCVTPMIQVSPLIFHLATMRWLMLTWHWEVNQLEFLRWDRESSSMVFRCHHYDPETRLCDSYRSRPGMCRDYPRALLDSPNPVFIEGCGHFPVARGAERMRDAIARVELDAKAREELERRLHLRQGPDAPEPRRGGAR
jgi:Fe-S-cluster containining protein